MHQLSAVSRQAAAFVSDVGQHQMWAAQSLELLQSYKVLATTEDVYSIPPHWYDKLSIAFDVV